MTMLVTGMLLMILQTPMADSHQNTKAIPIAHVQMVTARSDRGSVKDGSFILDGKPETEMTFSGVNSVVSVVLDLGKAYQVEEVEIVNGSIPVPFLEGIAIGPDKEHFRELSGRWINLPCWTGGESVTIPVAPAVGRFLQLKFRTGTRSRTGIKEVVVYGKENKPERHLMCWVSKDVESNYLECMDYYEKDLGVTDVWLDYVESAFPQTNPNAGFGLFERSGVFQEFQKRKIRYWLGEHESFGCLVNSPEALRDDQRWNVTLDRMRDLYGRAKKLGFRGLVFDSEDYDGVTPAAKEKYKDEADFVDCWCFNDEFGYGGYYYHRGLQVGQVIKDVWQCPLINVCETRMYAGIPGCRDGHYWFLKGINDAGIDIWIATEKTYGAGKNELLTEKSKGLEHLYRWFVDLRGFSGEVQKAFPFAKRYLPGFHPWNVRLGRPMYLPKYFDEQLMIARDTAFGYWIYNEGNSFGGDPRKTLDTDFCKKYQIDPNDYLKVLSKYSTLRN